MGFLWILLYIVVGVITGVFSTVVYWKTFPCQWYPNSPGIDNKISGVATGIFWPLGLPILVICVVYSKLMKLALTKFK